MDLEGRFTSSDALAEILRRACAELMSGVLTVTCGVSSTSAFDFYRGRLTGSDNPNRPRRLGRILLNRGLIDRAALEEALAYQADFAPGTPIGRVLVFRNKITADDLRDAVRIQIEDELATALACYEGFYTFKDSPSAEDEDPLVLLDTEALVSETLSRQKEWKVIREKISTDAVIPSVVTLDGSADRETIQLSTREWHILSLVNGYYDVGCIAARSGLGRFESYRVLMTLLSNGIVALHPPREPVAEGPYDEGEGAAERAKAAVGSSSSRWGSIISRLRDEADVPASDANLALSFDSPVSFLAEIGNRVVGRLMINQDFVIDPSDEKLAERHWRKILMGFPKADLVTADSNLLDASNFERYTRTLGVEGPMESVYLDTVDALKRYLRTLYLISAQRLGTKAARTLFADVMEDVKRRSTTRNAENFFFKEVATTILE